MGHRGNVDGEDMAHVEPRLRRLQCDESSDHSTCAGQQHERSSNLRDREDPLAAVRAARDACGAA